MTLRRARALLAWRRLQDAPVELSIAAVAVFIGIVNMVGRFAELSSFAWALYVVLAVGGAVLITGRMVDDSLALQSVGLSLLTGGWLFLTMRLAGRAIDPVDVTLAYACLGIALGFGVRLYVVRKKLRRRRAVAREVVARWSSG